MSTSTLSPQPPAAASAARPLVRRAEARDTAALLALFAVRRRTDEATGNDARGPELENPRRRLWVAFSGERAIGMTSVQLRQLQRGDRHHRLAYWTGLFVDPDAGSDFVYPQLMLAMLKGLREEGIRQLYAAVRRRPIAEAHVKMGFRKLGDIAVLAKPLRPAHLLACRKGLLRADGSPRWLRAFCSLPDAIVSAAVRVQCAASTGPATALDWTPANLVDLAALYARAGGATLSQAWTSESLKERYAAPAGRYRLLAIMQHGVVAAAAIARVVERPDGIRAAIVMDVVHEPAIARGAGMALAAVEAMALREGCDVVLFLDGLSGADARAARRRGYLESPETYALLVWNDKGAEPENLPADVRSWRFVFGDHDTF